MLKKLVTLGGLTLSLALPLFAAVPVNINTADAQIIANSLDGIGLAKAKAIVDFRNAHGPFQSVDALTQVKGIGPAVLERNQAAILLHDTESKATAGTPAPPARARKSKMTQETPAQN